MKITSAALVTLFASIVNGFMVPTQPSFHRTLSVVSGAKKDVPSMAQT